MHSAHLILIGHLIIEHVGDTLLSLMPDIWSSSQLNSITALWPSYTEWWQRHTGVNILSKVVTCSRLKAVMSRSQLWRLDHYVLHTYMYRAQHNVFNTDHNEQERKKAKFYVTDGQTAACKQGRLHHWNLGANDPWKILGEANHGGRLISGKFSTYHY